MLGLSQVEWMEFWGTASKERKQDRVKNLRMCMYEREDRLGNAREEKMSLCEWLEEPVGFRFAACSVPNEFGELYEECE